MEALRLWTVGSSWFSSEDGKKGSIVPGQLADLAVLSADYFSVPEEEIKHLESVLTVVGGKPVYAAEEFSKLAPPLPPVLPEWSPVAVYGGYARPGIAPVMARSQVLAAANVFSTPLTAAAWKTKPSWGVVAGGDKIINPDLERWYYARAHSHTIEIEGASHAVYESHPKEVAAVIEEAARHAPTQQVQ